uniref:Methyltransferase type 11 domain-containing protein n=1 Tax=Hucho hucho TaxID=62062 RepID=A0A4W5KMQ0_9TELE
MSEPLNCDSTLSLHRHFAYLFPCLNAMPRVCHFLSSLEPETILADVGSWNGKYLGINPEVIAVGCDRGSTLVQICSERGIQAFVSDALSVPLRSDTFDACISIAVIHHLSTQVHTHTDRHKRFSI